MENTNTTAPITLELNDAEKNLIIAQRAKEEAAKKETEARRQVEDAKRVENMNKEVVDFKRKETTKDAFATEFFADLQYNAPGKYELVKKAVQKSFEVKRYKDGSYYGGSSEEKIILASIEVPYNDYSIVSKEQIVLPTDYNQIVIDIVWYDNYRRGHNNEADWRVSIRGISDHDKHYRRAKLVHEKIRDYINAHKRAIESKKIALTLQEQVVEILKAKYPEATVEKYTSSDSRYEYGRRGVRRYTGNEEHQEVLVTFTNGMLVHYRFTQKVDGTPEFHIWSYNASTLDAQAIVEALKNVPAKVKPASN